MRLPDACTYVLEARAEHSLHVCGRSPISADYFERNDVKGEAWIASLCARCDRPAARRYAMARGYIRRDRRPELRALTEDELVAAYSGGEPA